MAHYRKTYLAAALFVLLWQGAIAQPVTKSDEDPARWSEEDRTLEQKYATSRKELAAAYQISVEDCNQYSSTEKQLCLDDAKREYERELSLLGFRLGPTR